MAQQPYAHLPSVSRHAVLHGWLITLEQPARQLAAVTAAGALLGLLVGGVGGRLAMMLLAALNPASHGVVSDDGFVMGRFTLAGTVDLLVAGTLLGLFGVFFYVTLRGLMIGPRWFKVLSISTGPAVVVGAGLVHTDGVDFVLLQPAWLAIALFVAIPGLYVALLTLLAERWLAPDSRMMRAPLWVVVVLLLLWVPIAPVLGVLAVGWLAYRLLRRSATGKALLQHPATQWAARGALVVLFAVSLAELTGDIRVLT